MNDARSSMAKAIASLPAAIRQAYCLHLLEGRDYRFIAAELGLAIGDVERAVAEAIVLIDRYLRASQRP